MPRPIAPRVHATRGLPIVAFVACALLPPAQTTWADDNATSVPRAAPAPAAAPAAQGGASDLATARAIEAEMVGAIDRVAHASVSVLNRRRVRRAGTDESALLVTSVGSGVVFRHGAGRDAKSWILTNLHVVENADRLEVVPYDGRARRVEVKAKSPRHDLAVLTFPQVPKGAEGIEFSSCTGPDPLPGEIVLATGNPFFLAGDGRCVATFGVVSGELRWIEAELLHGSTVLHDAPVNPGNSGGPLWSSDGRRLVGINETIATHSREQGSGPCSTGASYSIGADQVRHVLSEMLDPPAERPATWRGRTFATARDASGAAAGAQACDLGRRTGTPLAAIGLETGDVVRAVTVGARNDARVVTRPADLVRALDEAGANVPVRIDFRRSGRERSWTGLLPAR
jgi:serine protease Do